MEGAFQAGEVEGMRILLVDDVITSGATMTACADALLQSRAKTVSAAALCGEPMHH
ncbi:MAG: ComF family protein [Fimbriimonadaceae bacterium]